MTDLLDGVRDHYRATGLTERLKAVLSALGPEDQRLTPQQLGALDQFHTRGLAATAELAKLAGITADMSVLDVGSGVGGPARFLAATSPTCRFWMSARASAGRRAFWLRPMAAGLPASTLASHSWMPRAI